MDFFRDPAWQFIGTIIAAIGLAATYFKFYLERKKKIIILSYKSLPLLNSSRPELEIFYDGVKLSSASLTICKIRNAGRSALVREDFDHPVWFRTSERQRVIFYHASDVRMQIEEVGENDKSGIAPFLLNEGEEIEIQVASTGGYRNVELDLRIISGTVFSEREYDVLPSVMFKRFALKMLGQTTNVLFTLSFLYLGTLIARKLMG